MRSPKWMAAYAVALAMIGGTYFSVVYLSPGVALVFGLAALVAVLIALALVIFR